MTRADAARLGAHCHSCPIAKRHPEAERPPVPPRGPAGGKAPKLVIISDNPGRTDEQMRKSLAGAGGKFLFIELAKVGILESDCYITHASLCRGEGDKENEKAAECCAPRLLHEVAAVFGASGEGPPAPLGPIPTRLGGGGPILVLGKSPCRAILAVRKAGHARGFAWRIPETKVLKAPALPKEGSKRKVRVESAKARLARETGEARNALRKVVSGAGGEGGGDSSGHAQTLPTLALSFILKADAWVSVFRRDLNRLGRLAGGRPMSEEGGKPEAVGGLGVLEGLGPEVSCDIETDGIDPRKCGILCVGFGDLQNGRVAVLWPWKKEYAKPLGEWLGSRKRVVFHNGFNFDLLVLRAHGCAW